MKVMCYTTVVDKLGLEPALIVLEHEKLGSISILRKFKSDGDPDYTISCRKPDAPIGTQDVINRERFTQNFEVTREHSQFGEVTRIISHALVPGPFHRAAATVVGADFWSAANISASRPGSHGESPDVFTFEALKEMWKAIGKSGFSSKSKSDLYEGFAESANDMATGAESSICDKLPAKMIKLESTYSINKLRAHTQIKSPAQVLALTSRTSSKVLYNKDASPEITNDTLRLQHVFVDLADFYADNPEKNMFSTDQEALAALKVSDKEE